MLKHLKSREIVRAKWEACIRSSESSIVYASSFFLDAMPEAWEAIVDERSDLDGNSYYHSVFPFQIKRKAFLNYVLQNPFLKELGVIQVAERSNTDTGNLDLLKMAFKDLLYVRNYSVSEKMFTGDLEYYFE